MTDRTRVRVRRAIVLAGLAVLAVACDGQDGDSTSATTGVTEAPGTTTTVAGTDATVPADPAAPDATAATVDLPEPDGPALLLASLAAAAEQGYHFTTTVLVGDEIVLVADGDRVGDGTRLMVSSNGETVDYVITPEGAWAGQDGVWQELETTDTLTDPLAALADPIDLTVAAFGDGTATLLGTYRGETLGLPDTETVDVTLEIVGERLVAMSYTAPGGSPPSTSRTEISAPTDTSAVTTPDI